MSGTYYPKARSEDLVILTQADETLVYDITAGQAHCLNETAAFVWNECSGKASISEIGRSVEKRFGQTASDDFVKLALAQLADRKLVNMKGLSERSMPSRREAIKKIGFSSALAIPIIASVVVSSNAFGSLSCDACTSSASCLQFPQCGNFCNNLGQCRPSASVG